MRAPAAEELGSGHTKPMMRMFCMPQITKVLVDADALARMEVEILFEVADAVRQFQKDYFTAIIFVSGVQ